MAEVDASRPQDSECIELLSDSDTEEQAQQVRVFPGGWPCDRPSGRHARDRRVTACCRGANSPHPPPTVQRGSPPGEVSGRGTEEARRTGHVSQFPVRRRRVLPLPQHADVVPGSPDDIVLVSSTVRPARRGGVVKRPRQARLWQEPVKGALIAAAGAGDPVADVQAGPKCGICLEPMGGAAKRAMASGPCG